MKEKWGRIKWEIVITFVISFTSIFVAIKANNISKMQAEIARNSALPMIEVEEKIKEGNDIGWEESSVIEISNLSGKMNNYQAEVVTFLSCGYFAGEAAEYEVVDIPIENYYLLNTKEGTATGIIERKDSIGNYAKVKKLNEAILQFNKENQEGKSIDSRLQSYLKISYLDLLNEKQVLYYSLDMIDVKLIDSDIGEMQFDKYNRLTEDDIGVNTNRLEEVSVEEVLDTIEEILSLDTVDLANQDIDVLEESKMNILNEPITNTVIGAIIGFVASVLGGWIVYRREKRNRESFAASVLYNDLRSIERYLAYERSSVNLRYSEEWQRIVAECPFFNAEDIEWIYQIYDEVYNYNYHYRCKEQSGTAVRKEDICSYTKLKKKMFDTAKGYPDFKKYSEEYDMVIKKLQKYKK